MACGVKKATTSKAAPKRNQKRLHPRKKQRNKNGDPHYFNMETRKRTFVIDDERIFFYIKRVFS